MAPETTVHTWNLCSAGKDMEVVSEDLTNYRQAMVDLSLARNVGVGDGGNDPGVPYHMFGAANRRGVLFFALSCDDEMANLEEGAANAGAIAGTLHEHSRRYRIAEAKAINTITHARVDDHERGLVPAHDYVSKVVGTPAHIAGDLPSVSRISHLAAEIDLFLQEAHSGQGEYRINDEAYGKWGDGLPPFEADREIDLVIDALSYVATNGRETFDAKVATILKALYAKGVWEGDAATAARDTIESFNAAGEAFATRAELRHQTFRDTVDQLNPIYQRLRDIIYYHNLPDNDLSVPTIEAMNFAKEVVEKAFGEPDSYSRFLPVTNPFPGEPLHRTHGRAS